MLRNVERYGDRVVLAGASVALALESIDRPREFWHDHGYIVGVAIAALAVVGVLTPFDRLNRRRLKTEREQAWQGALDALDEIERDTSIPIKNLTVHVWLPRRTLRAGLKKELVRPLTLRVGYHRANRVVRFVERKGAVGWCWAKNDEVVRSHLSVDFAGVTTASDWASLVAARGEEFTMGLSFEDFERTRHLQGVVAVPIRNGTGGFIGCVSADVEGAPGGDLAQGTAALRKLAQKLGDVDLTQL